MSEPAKITRHYRRFLAGEGFKLLERDGISIWQFDTKDGSLLITTGMSAHFQVVPTDEECVSQRPRTELMIFVGKGDEPALSNLLLDIANYPRAQKSFLHWWHSLPLGRPIIPNAEITSLLFTFPPFDEEFATFEVDGERIDVLWVVPISETERVYFKQNGADVLEELLESNRVEVANLLRKPVV